MYHSIVILVHLENGRLERAVCLHQILLQTGIKFSEHSLMLKSSVWRGENGNIQFFEWFSKFKSDVTTSFV